MRFHTSLLGVNISDALNRVTDRGQVTRDVVFAVFESQPSQTHPRSYEIQLGTDDRYSLPAGYTDQHGRHLRVRRARNGAQGSQRYSATWHEWGWLMAELFTADPGSRWGDNPARARHPHGYFSPEDFHAKTDDQFKPAQPEPQEATMPETQTLRAYREDGTEVRPGDTVTQFGNSHWTFRGVSRALDDERQDGFITVDSRRHPDQLEMYASPFGLTVREVREPTLRAYRADGTEVRPGDTVTQMGTDYTFISADSLPNPHDGKITVETSHGDIIDGLYASPFDLTVRAVPAAPVEPAASGQPEPDPSRQAPPKPGITQNMGKTLYGVLPSGTHGTWWVVMKDDREHVTWCAAQDGEGGLHYDSGHYHTTGTDGSGRKDALVDLANRAGIFTMLTELNDSDITRKAYQGSHEAVLETLATLGVGRARVRAGLLEAAALGRARVTWHHDGRRQDYEIRYDRVSCTFTWSRA